MQVFDFFQEMRFRKEWDNFDVFFSSILFTNFDGYLFTEQETQALFFIFDLFFFIFFDIYRAEKERDC